MYSYIRRVLIAYEEYDQAEAIVFDLWCHRGWEDHFQRMRDFWNVFNEHFGVMN